MFTIKFPAAACGLLLLAGQASSAPPARDDPAWGGAGRYDLVDDQDDEGVRREALFISPSGEPFRAGGGEPYPVAAWFHQADRNQDGKLDRAEFVADAERFFHVLDRNGDGVIDGEEVRVYEHVVAPEILARGRAGAAAANGAARLQQVADIQLAQGGGMGGMGGGGRGGGRQGGKAPSGGQTPKVDPDLMAGAAPYNLLAEPEPVTASDLSFSGQITLADFKQRADQRFDALVPVGESYLTLAGLPKTRAQEMMGSPHPRRRAAGPPRG